MAKSRKKNGKTTLNAYRPDMELGFSRRIAHFLAWAAEHQPGELFQYNVVLKMAMGYKRAPSLNSDQVEHVRRNLYAIGKALEKYHDRFKVSVPGLGVRASVDDDDVARHVITNRSKRFAGAKNSLETAVNAVDPRKIRDPAMRKWISGSLRNIMRTINAADFDIKALPPAESE